MAPACNVSANQTRNPVLMGRTLVLMGRTGNGKSSTGNSILGSKAFHAPTTAKSVTKECKMQHCTPKDYPVLNLIDTPGVFDTNVPREDFEREIVKCINIAGCGIHAVLVVVSLTNRFTDEEEESIHKLTELFGPKIFDYMMLVFTHGDALETSLEHYLEDCPMSLQRTIDLCKSRMVVFNNHKSASANVKETQITELLEKVERIVADNKFQPYSNDLFLEAKEMSSQEMSSQEKQNKDKEKQYEEKEKQYEEKEKQYKEKEKQYEEKEKQYEEKEKQNKEKEKHYKEKKKQYKELYEELKKELYEELKKGAKAECCCACTAKQVGRFLDIAVDEAVSRGSCIIM